MKLRINNFIIYGIYKINIIASVEKISDYHWSIWKLVHWKWLKQTLNIYEGYLRVCVFFGLFNLIFISKKKKKIIMEKGQYQQSSFW